MRVRIRKLIVGLCLCPVVIGSQPSAPEKHQKVAEGTYHYAYATAARNETIETWVLYRTDDGFVVQSESKDTSANFPDGQISTSQYWFDKQMVLTRWEREMAWAPLKRIGCEIGKRELRCWDGWRGENRQRISEPYEVVPLFIETTWQLASLVHRSGALSGKSVRLRVITWDIADGPKDVTERPVDVAWIGQETLDTAAGEFEVHRVRLVSADEMSEPPRKHAVDLLMSKEGLLLGIQSSEEGGGARSGFSLVSYAKYAEFGPGR